MRVGLLRLGVAWADSGRMTLEEMRVVATEYERQEAEVRRNQPDAPRGSSPDPFDPS